MGGPEKEVGRWDGDGEFISDFIRNMNIFEGQIQGHK